MRAKRSIVVVDVDVFADGLSLATTDEERGHFCLGFNAGIRGTEGREDADEHFRRGYGIGIEQSYLHQEKRRKCSEAGRRGHLRRLERQGLAPWGDTLPNHPTVHPTVPPSGDVVDGVENHPTVQPYGDTPRCHPTVPPSGDTTPIYVPDVPSTENRTYEGLLELPCKGGEFYAVTQKTLDGWKEAFPGLDGLAEARRMKFWLESHKERLKTPRGMARFFSIWLGNATDRSKTRPLQSSQILKTTQVDEYLEANPDLFQEVDHAS